MKSDLKALLIVMLICSLQPSGYAQQFVPFSLGEPQPVFRNINITNGLPSSECYDVLQDNHGYIWISTDRGVVRYDGFRYQVFTTKSGLADDVIFKLYEDYKGRIWFVSYNGLLSYWEYAPAGQIGGRIVKYKYNNRISEFLGDFIAGYKSLVVGRDEKVYYALYNEGGISIDSHGRVKQLGLENITLALPIGNQWLPVSFLKKQPFHAVYKDSKGKIRRMGSYTIGPGQLNMSGHYMQHGDDVFDILTGKKLFTEKNLISQDIIENELFLGIYKGGVRRESLSYPRNHPQRTSYLLRNHSVSGMTRDHEGGYWFTTLDNGVYYTPNLLMKSYTTEQGLQNAEYAALGGIGDDVYMSAAFAFTKLTSPSVQMVFTDQKRPGIGSTRNMVFFNWMRDAVRSFPEQRIICVPYNKCAFFCSENYVLASGNGVWRMYPDGRVDTLYIAENKPRRTSLNFLYGITETPGGKVYVGNQKGLFKVENKDVSKKGLSDPLFRSRVIEIDQHPRLKTVVATRNEGIFCFDENEKITHRITPKNGLIGDLVSCLYIDPQGYIYAGTNQGLTVLQLKPDGTFRHWVITTCHGICSDEISDVYRQGDRIWIATKKGVSTFDMKEIRFFKRGGIGLADISIDGQTYRGKKNALLIKPNVQLVKIAIRTDNFSGSGHHRFLYRLRNGGTWLQTQEPEITLNEPRWGDYQVSVRFLNDSGTWSKAVPLVKFTVDPPFYAAWYFIAMVSLAIIALAFWIFKSVLKRVKQRHRYQTRISQLEQKALRAQMNPHFIFNSLNSIQSFLIYDENEKAERYLLRFAQLIRQTLNNSRESYITIESEMETLRRYLELEQMRFKDKFSFEVVSHLSAEELAHGVPPMLIQPYVENSVLHGFKTIEEGGKITIVFESLKNNCLFCTVDDNGIGRKASVQHRRIDHKSFGTKITAERLEAFRQKYGDNFSITIIDKTENDQPAGTKVNLLIPVVQPHEITSSDDL